MIENFAVLLTCFNRKDTTLRCLNQLYLQNFQGKMDVFLCDDGSNDGTYEAVKEQYPFVHIFKGTGNLFWNRGMLASWEKACETKDYDAYIWLNDDVFLYGNAIKEILECASLTNYRSIICGAFCSEKEIFSYGGRHKDHSPIEPNGTLQNVYWLNGNCVLVPRVVVKKIGLLDRIFQHHLGDFDYGLRAIEAGIEIFSTRKYLGVCSPNTIVSSRARKNGLTLFGRFKRLYSPMGDNPFIQFKYTLRHFGFRKAVLIFMSLHFVNLLSDHLYAKRMLSRH